MSSFFADPQRDASDVIAGFVYQIDVTVQRWLGLKDGEVLELERGEDLDLVKVDGDGLPGTRVLEQLKRRSTSAISLKSPDALTAIARFCEHRKNNPADRLRFRFLSTAGVATERAWNGQGTAISTWQSIQRGQLSDADQEKGLDDIRNFLETCSAPDGVSSEAWALVTDLLKKENASELIEVIGSFEWGLGSTDYPKVETEVKVALIQGGLAENEAVADSIFERLFLFVFKRVSETGIKRLTLTDLKTQLELPTLTFRDKAFLTFIDDLRGLGRRIERLESQSEITSQVVLALGDKTSALEERIALGMSISVPRPSFDRPALITPILPRTESVENILGQLTKSSWINVIGEPGSGKTQLCLLTTERSGRDTFWINLRGCSPEQACDVIDRALELASRIPFSPFLSRWYQQATSSLGAGKIFVLDDLPRVASGGALAQRLGLLAAATKSNGQQILSASYYPLPNQIAETHELFEISSPRFEVADVSELLRAAGAPEGFPTEQIADFLVALTGGLPLMVAAAARILQAHNWTIGRETLESFFGGGYARGLKTDAQAMIESTVPNAETRELLYRLSVVIGPFTKQQVETISKVDQKIRLAGEKLEQLIGLWIQPYATETFRLSPLIEASLAQRLDSDTRTGVHAVLALDLLKRKITTVLDVMTCIHHFQTAELTGHAADVLMKALLPITQTDQEVPNERLLLSVWNPGPLPSTINLNVRLLIRAQQIELADKQGLDISGLLSDLDRMMEETQSNPDAQFGALGAAGSITIRFGRKYPSIANRYLLALLRSAREVVLPDGSRPDLHYKKPLESLLWMTANSAGSDADVESWIATLREFSAEQIRVLDQSDLAADSCVVLCDQVWLREFRKPEYEQDWPSRIALVQKIEKAAKYAGMGLLYAAAVRARLTIIGESQEKLDEAIAIANERLSDMTTNTERFLVLETTGRQLAYAGRDEDALTWMDRAIQLNIEEYGIFRRNVLITAGEVVAKSNPKGAVAYTTAAVEVARTAILGRVHLAEALAEHSLALWNAGNREESFAAWDEGVETLLAARDQKPWWTKAFLAFLQTAGYFSGMSLWGKITDPNFAIPKPGFFLALDNMPVERYQPIQDGLLLLRTAMFAEGVVNTSAAAKWAVRAYAEARKQPGTDLMDSFAWLPIPHWIETGAYDQAIEYAFTLSKKKRADEASLDAFALTGQDRKRAEEFFAEPKVVDRTFLFFLVPIALHLAAVRFDRDITKELATITNKMESLSAESDDPWKEAAHFLSSIFSGETSWKDWHDEIGPLYSSGRLAFGLLASLASVLEAPLKQSLVSQIGLARNLEQVFKISPSIRGTFVAPFFTRYWQDAVATRSELFRTPYAVTQKAHSEAAALPIGVRVKGLLAKMVFCTNLNLSDMSEELRTWIEEAS